jgi:hypothetical protein
MAINIPTFSIPRPPKYTHIGIFGEKIYHLVTLIHSKRALEVYLFITNYF